MPWYIVVAAWPTSLAHPHLGLGGEAWPLDPVGEKAREAAHESRWALVWIGGCSFEVCVDRSYAQSYYDLARSDVPRLRLIEVRDAAEHSPEGDGVDMGRPSGGFSAAGEICERTSLVERYGSFLNDVGLFASVSRFEEYMRARAGREALDGLEYLDESALVSVRVLEFHG